MRRKDWQPLYDRLLDFFKDAARTHYDGNELEKGFKFWAVGQVLTDTNLSDDQVKEPLKLDGRSDLGIDGYFEDSEGQTLILVQSKFHQTHHLSFLEEASMPSYIARIDLYDGEHEYSWPIFIDAPDRRTAARLAQEEARTFWSFDDDEDEGGAPETDGSGRHDWIYEGVSTRFSPDSTSLVEVKSLDDVRRALYSVTAEDAVTA